MFRFTIRRAFWCSVSVLFVGIWVAFISNVARSLSTSVEWSERSVVVGKAGVVVLLAGLACSIIAGIGRAIAGDV
jgi:hypothetical protein